MRGQPSAEQAQAWLDYGRFQPTTQEGEKARDRAMARALEVAEAVGATALVARVLSFRAYQAFTDGKIAEGFALVDRGLDLAEAAGDAGASLWVAVEKSYALASTGQNAAAVDVALSALATARDTGRQSGLHAAMLVANAASALLATGRTAEAAALVDPLTGGAPDRDHWIMHLSRGEIDMVRGDIATAAGRRMRLSEVTGELGSGVSRPHPRAPSAITRRRSAPPSRPAPPPPPRHTSCTTSRRIPSGTSSCAGRSRRQLRPRPVPGPRAEACVTG
jgi:hypothetical protein